MTEQSEEHFLKRDKAFCYFILSYCLLVPTAGTMLILFILTIHKNSETPAPASYWPLISICAFYLSSFLLGICNARKFSRLSKREEVWALMVGIALSGILSFVTVGMLVLSIVISKGRFTIC